MTTVQGSEMLTAGKMAEALGVSQGKVKKLIEEFGIEPDEIKRGCKYYGSSTLKKLKAEVQKA
jgi:plasmid maintenance system antidote protein VapI